MLPSVGLSMPAIRLSKVDFPLPDFPVTATSCPFFILRLTSFNASNVPDASEKDLVIPVSSIRFFLSWLILLFFKQQYGDGEVTVSIEILLDVLLRKIFPVLRGS